MTNPGSIAQLIWNNQERPPYYLNKIITTIGRNEANDIFLDDPKVSSFHGNILNREDGYHLLDMKSRNGTWVNGKKVSVWALKDGDLIEFGEIRISFQAQPLFPKTNIPLAKLNQKIQTMAVTRPGFKKEAEEIIREVEKHQSFLNTLINITSTLTESHSLQAFAEKLLDVFMHLLECKNVQLLTEKKSTASQAQSLQQHGELLTMLLDGKVWPEKGGSRLVKTLTSEGDVRMLLAFQPSQSLGWVVFFASGVVPLPKDEILDLLDIILLFASTLWRNLDEIENFHHKETERLLDEKEKESQQRITVLEKQNQELDQYLQQIHNRLVFADGSLMERIFELIRKLATVDLPVLITGETGTGKTYIAQLLHNFSIRAQKGFYIIDCATIPANLIESELFGYEKGAFSGATGRKIGKVEAANGGTVFLDEIGDLPLELQGKLLRFVQEGKFERLGGTETIHVDVRIIAATNYNLEERVKAGKFRQDLFFRLHVLPLHIPPLRQRTADIPILAKHFISKHFGGADWAFTPDANEALTKHSWPGNVRELENKLQRAWIFHVQGVISASDLGFGPQNPVAKDVGDVTELEKRTLEQYREEYESAVLLRCLKFYKGNITKCAEHLEISRNTCKSMLRKYKLMTGVWDKGE